MKFVRLRMCSGCEGASLCEGVSVCVRWCVRKSWRKEEGRGKSVLYGVGGGEVGEWC